MLVNDAQVSQRVVQPSVQAPKHVTLTHSLDGERKISVSTVSCAHAASHFAATITITITTRATQACNELEALFKVVLGLVWTVHHASSEVSKRVTNLDTRARGDIVSRASSSVHAELIVEVTHNQTPLGEQRDSVLPLCASSTLGCATARFRSRY